LAGISAPTSEANPEITSSFDDQTSHVSGDLRNRLATYALDSPTGTQQRIDETLTPAPEVAIPQSMSSLRKQTAAEEISGESEEEAFDYRRRPVSRAKRTITTVLSSSQMEAITGAKRSKTDANVEPTGLLQSSLRKQFVREADKSEAALGINNDMMEVLSSEQVADICASVRETEGDAEMEANEIRDSIEDVDPEADIEEADEISDDVGSEDTPDAVEWFPVDNPTKSQRNIFKSRQTNTVHSLRTKANVTLDTIRSQFHVLRQARIPSSQQGTIPSAEYAESNEKAEERLSLTVSKEDFSKMRIVGQFNLGFIIAIRDHLDNDHEDVFIIDQHASDEKYNFEKLQAETVMQVQTLAKYSRSQVKKTKRSL